MPKLHCDCGVNDFYAAPHLVVLMHLIRKIASIPVSEIVVLWKFDANHNSANCNIVEKFVEQLILADCLRRKERKQFHRNAK